MQFQALNDNQIMIMEQLETIVTLLNGGNAAVVPLGGNNDVTELELSSDLEEFDREEGCLEAKPYLLKKVNLVSVVK